MTSRLRFAARLAALATLSSIAAAQTCAPNPAVDLQVTVSPLLALPGQTVQITIANQSTACTYQLFTPCIYDSIHSEACDQDPLVFNPSCPPGPTSLPPGGSIQGSWDLNDGLGNPVGDDLYVFHIPVLPEVGGVFELCVPVQVGLSCVKPFQYGFGTQGAGGRVPAISSAGGFPTLGNFGFQLFVSNAVGGALAFCVGSAAPASFDLGFGNILVDLGQIVVSGPETLAGTPGTPGQGFAFFDAPVPFALPLIGLELFWQWAVIDSAATGGVALSEGLRIALCM